MTHDAPAPGATGMVVCDVTVSVDGFVAGPRQSQAHPLGEGPVESMHAWMFDTAEENRFEVDRITAAGAYVMGRNMFGPVRGEWDRDWRGWWGEDPPYHAPVFVLTHHPRDPVPMEGGTTFRFVTDGVATALARAREAAGARDVAVAGGASTINQFLRAGLLDELRVHIAPLVLGSGERLFADVGPVSLEVVSARAASLVTHVDYRVGPPGGRPVGGPAV